MTQKQMTIQWPDKDFSLVTNALVIKEGVSYEKWLKCGEFLSKVEGATHWWIGDWVNYGDNRWGEKYKEALEKTNFAYQTLADDSRICSNFEITRRRIKLPYSYHRDVMALNQEEQDELLEKAEKENWTRAKLRIEVERYKIRHLLSSNSTIENNCIIHGDFREICNQYPDDSIHHIFTDPPYGEQYLDLWASLAEIASRILKPTGYCICYSGVLHLPKVYQIMTEHLSYYWQCVLIHKGGAQLIKPRNLNTGYKPILVFAKEPLLKIQPSIIDVFTGTGKEKSLHKWAQAEGEAKDIIKKFTQKGQTILDPFAGSGTIPVATQKTGRKYIAIEKNRDDYEVIKNRLWSTEQNKN